jgi:hypothetical protein
MPPWKRILHLRVKGNQCNSPVLLKDMQTRDFTGKSPDPKLTKPIAID